MPDDIPGLFIFLPALADPAATWTQPLDVNVLHLVVFLKMFLHHPLPQLNNDLTGLIILLDKCPQLIQFPVPEHLLETSLCLHEEFFL